MQRTGFTLFELLVALSLATVLGAVAVPGMRRSIEGWRMNAAARQVVMDLKRARAQAITQAASHRLRFAPPAAGYQLERQEGANGAYAAIGPATALPEGITVVECTAVGASVTFRPRGHAGTFGTIRLRNADGVERRVVVDIAGRMRVQ